MSYENKRCDWPELLSLLRLEVVGSIVATKMRDDGLSNMAMQSALWPRADNRAPRPCMVRSYAADMAAAHQPGFSSDDHLHSLRSRLTTLEKEHERMQQEYERLYTHHGKKCAASLQNSIQTLFKVIVFVRKADKSLVEWHYRSDGLKTALRVFGLDMRTKAMIEKKTHKLQDKVQRVEKKFDNTSLVFDDGLQEAKRMKSGFLEFSLDNVEKVSQQALSTLDTYQQEYERVDTLIKQQNAEHKSAHSKAMNAKT